MKTNLEIPDTLIRDAVNASISNEMKKLNIEAIIKSEVEKRIIALSNKGINDGSLISLVAKKVASNYKPRKWYNKHIFPLIPTLEIKKANEHNTSGFTFKWLIFTIWTIDSPSFELAIVADTHWGVGIIGLLPFFRWVISIPCPEKVEMWINIHFSRARRFYNSN